MNLKTLIQEHKRLLQTLGSNSKLDDKVESIVQSGELAEYAKKAAARPTLESKVRAMVGHKDQIPGEKMKKSAGQYQVHLGPKPAQEQAGRFAQWHLSKNDLAHILNNWDSVHWDLRSGSRPSVEGNFHSTAITRKNLTTPIKSYLHVNKPQGRVLYHGVGRDDLGAQALGAERYDPFHPDPKVRQAPSGKFDEVHSHYTLNVVDKDTGRKILEHIHGLLSDGGKAVISVRRDLAQAKK